MQHASRFLLVFIASLANDCLLAQSHGWRNQDGSKTVHAEFVRRDASSVTLRRQPSQTEFTLPISQLHVEDLTWLNQHHPLHSPAPEDCTAVFDQLLFGDSRDQVMVKLKASQFVELTVGETFLGRTGMNGVFRIRKPLGGLHATLDFDWDENGGLRELTLQSDPQAESDAGSKLRPCWNACIDLLTELYGKPAFANPGFSVVNLPDGSMSGTHLWKLEPRGSVMLGASRNGSSYCVAIRFTRKELKPVAMP